MKSSLLLILISCIMQPAISTAQITIKSLEGTTRIDVNNYNGHTFVGHDAGANSPLGFNFYNTAFGSQALKDMIDGNQNVAIGTDAMKGTLYGDDNCAIGFRAMYESTFSECSDNVAIGTYALYHNLGGSSNVSIGRGSMQANLYGWANTAIGTYALGSNAWGTLNTAIGYNSQQGADSNSYNCSLGALSMVYVEGDYNVAIGANSMQAMTAGGKNTVLGALALNETLSANRTVAIGYDAGGTIEVGSFNTYVGSFAKGNVADQINSIAIGDAAIAAGSNQVRLGDNGVSWIGGQVNWSAASDARFKTNIRNSSLGLDFISKLRPVEYEMQINTEKEGGNGHIGKTYTGFIAQEVEQALNALGTDFSGLCRPVNQEDFYSLRYAEFTVPLVKSTQELLAKIQNQQSQIDTLSSQNAVLLQRLDALEARLNSAN